MSVILFLCCLVVSFMFSGIEAGVLSVSRVRLRYRASQGERSAAKLEELLRRVEHLMVTVVLINGAANIAAIAILYGWFARWLGSTGGIAAVAVAIPVFVGLLEFLPRAIFLRFPYRTLSGFVRVLAVAHTVFVPVVQLGERMLRAVFGSRIRPARFRCAGVEDILNAVRASSADGCVSPTARDFVSRVTAFRDVRVRDVFVPFSDATSVCPETFVAQILDRARSGGVDRFALIDAEGVCHGIVRAFDLLRDGVVQGRAQSYVRRVPEFVLNTPARDALTLLRAARVSTGVVLDLRGVSVGLIHSEALVRQLLAGKK